MKSRLILMALCCLTILPVWSAEPLRIGFYTPALRDANKADLKASLGVWTEEVGKPFGVRILSFMYDDIAAMRGAVDRRDINFINAPGMELAELFAPEEIREGYARRHLDVEEGLALVVAGDSPIRSFADLRGKSVWRLSGDRLSEVYLETQCLKTFAQNCKTALALKEEKRDIQSIYAVFFGRADAALVYLPTLNTARELNPQVGQRLRVLHDWKARAVFFGMMTRHTDPAYRGLILKSAREAVKTPRGRQLLELFRTDYLEPVDADDIKPYWALLREYRELSGRVAGGRK
jgi:hypothetical protein